MSGDAPLATLRFPTVGGEQPATLYPAVGECRALALVLPALGLRAGYYGELARALSDGGVATVPLDFPGHGQSPVRAGRDHDWGYRELVEHTLAAREAAVAAVPGVPVLAVGHSIGGQVALLAAGLAPDAFRGVALIASGSPHWRAFPGATGWGIRAAGWVAPSLSSLVGHFPGETVRFGGREARRLMTEWASLARTGAYTFPGFDGEAALAAVRAPVLAVRVEGDELAPEAAMEDTLQKLVGAPVERRAWTGLPPENVHNRWPRTTDPAAAYVRALLSRVA